MQREYRSSDIIGKGEFAHIFADTDLTRVCKLYLARDSVAWRQWAPRVQSEEITAYGLAGAIPALAPHIPVCGGAITVSRVLDEAGNDVSGRYLLSLGILLERVNVCEEQKAVALTKQQYPYIWMLIHEFEEAGIYIGDASALNYSNDVAVRFIDFTTGFGARLVAEVIGLD